MECKERGLGLKGLHTNCVASVGATNVPHFERPLTGLLGQQRFVAAGAARPHLHITRHRALLRVMRRDLHANEGAVVAFQPAVVGQAR